MSCISIYTNKIEKYNCLYQQQNRQRLLNHRIKTNSSLLNMFPNNKQGQAKKNDIKKESYLNYTTITKYIFGFLIFSFFR